ncbi:hypothetical protein KCP78_09125 [Salmonella enterica subsp. enterica]|nr:hypothetical protein KCP78_09125 [Salmonella enterica subsp. enterica]
MRSMPEIVAKSSPSPQPGFYPQDHRNLSMMRRCIPASTTACEMARLLQRACCETSPYLRCVSAAKCDGKGWIKRAQQSA